MPDVAVSGAARIAPEIGRHIFGADVAGYHAARMGYPDELYALIQARVRSPSAIAEIGPGTGLATERLIAWRPDRFVAFEPDALLATHLRETFSTVEVIDQDFCTAEVEPAFDVIAAASSFHWLDSEAALTKARALLRPGGTLALWWNVYRQKDIGDAFADAVLPLLDGIELPPSEAASGHYALDEPLHRGRLELAGFQRIEHRVFRREQVLTPSAARALYASFSMIRKLEHGRAVALLDAIERTVQDQFDGAAPSVVLTPIYFADAPDPPTARARPTAASG